MEDNNRYALSGDETKRASARSIVLFFVSWGLHENRTRQHKAIQQNFTGFIIFSSFLVKRVGSESLSPTLYSFIPVIHFYFHFFCFSKSWFVKSALFGEYKTCRTDISTSGQLKQLYTNVLKLP